MPDEVMYIPLRDARPRLIRAEIGGVVVGGIAELGDGRCEWYCRLPGWNAGGQALTLAEAQAALEAHLGASDGPEGGT